MSGARRLPDRRVLAGTLLILAVALRLGFVLRLPDLPLYWDEVHYDGWATPWAQAWQALGTAGEFHAKFETAFTATLQKGEAYAAFVGAVYALAGPHHYAVFVAQALLDGGTCLLVYDIAGILAGPQAALVALALAAVYPPFIFAAGRLQSETLAAFLCSGALWAFLRPWRRHERVGLGVSGFLLALAMLARPAFQFLFPLWLPLAAWVPRDASRHPLESSPLARGSSGGLPCGASTSPCPSLVRRGSRGRWRLARCAAFAAGFFLLVGPRLMLTDRLGGHPLWSGTTDPSINAYAGIVFDNLGWRTDHMAFNQLGELPAVLQARGHRNPEMEDYRLATARTWERHPLESAAVLLHKTYIVWRHPYNDSLRRFVFGARAQRCLHQAMLVLAAIGLPLALRNWRIGLPLVLTVLYIWATYLAVQIEVRYVVTAVPLMICCAACALTLLGSGWRTQRTRGQWLLGLLLLASVLLLRAATIGRLVAPPFQLSPAGAYNLHRGLVILVMLDVTVLAALSLQRAVPRWWALAATALPGLAGALIFLVGGSLANLWHNWVFPLTAGDAVRQDFVLPPGLPPPARAEIRLDLSGYGSVRTDLVVTMNGVEAKRFVGGPTMDNAVAPEDFYRQIFAGQGRPPRPWHAWYAVPVDPSVLAGGQRLRVEARVEGDAQRTGGVQVFGDYAVDGGATYDGPSPVSPEWNADTSVYKYLGDSDFRMRRQYPFSGECSSSYFDGHRWRTGDLSPLPGRQFGRYRIVLLLEYPNGRVMLF